MKISRLTVHIMFILLAVGFLAGAANAAPVFYSVGQNTSDHKTGSPTITISGGTATFSVAQTAVNMGVGDRVTYNGGSIAYISGKISATQWTLVTVTGGTPANVTGQTVDSIAHEFTSLSAAITGASDVNHLATTDLAAGVYQLNIPCYYDSGPDSTPVTISGYTTDATNYIRIYTPINTSTEVNQSQRHSGKWDSNRYYMQINNAGAITPAVSYTVIEGLQIMLTGSTNDVPGIANFNNGVVGNIRINGNIIRSLSSGTGLVGIAMQEDSLISNNIIFDFNTSGSYGIFGDYIFILVKVENNTVYGCTNGISFGSFNTFQLVRAVNNLVSNCVANWPASGAAWEPNTDYNLSTDSTISNVGTHNRSMQTVLFVNAASRNLHLSPFDTAARDAGIDLSGDTTLSFNTDIDGQTRSGAWDIGADEYVPESLAPVNVQYTIGNGARITIQQ